MDGHLPIVLIEIVLIFGGVLAFGWWQLREIEVDRRKAAAERAAREAREESASQGANDSIPRAADGAKTVGAGPAP